jgi:hypothetical protein
MAALLHSDRRRRDSRRPELVPSGRGHAVWLIDDAPDVVAISAGPALLNDARYRASGIAVIDGFNVVPIGVEDECGVVPGVIVRSQPRPSVVDPSGLDGCGVERINRFAAWRGERDVHRTGRHFLLRDPEVSAIVDREAGPLRVFDDPDTEGLQRPLVERATPCDVAYWQPHMIKQARWPTWHGSSIPH